MGPGSGTLAIVPEQLKGFLEVPSPHDRQVQAHQRGQPLLLVSGEVPGILQLRQMKWCAARELHVAGAIIGSDLLEQFELDTIAEAYVPVIRAAIRSRQMVRFYYDGGVDPGYRTVEPHTIDYNEANHLTLGAWCVSGAGASHEDQGWREYLLSEMSLVTVLPVYFFGSRRDCPSDRGTSLHNLQCAP